MAFMNFFNKKSNTTNDEQLEQEDDFQEKEHVLQNEKESPSHVVEVEQIEKDNVCNMEEELSPIQHVETLDEQVDSFDKEVEKKVGILSKISTGLNKTRQNIMSVVDNVFKNFTKIDEALFEELEEALIMADIGVETSMLIIENLRQSVKLEKITEGFEVRQCLINEIKKILEEDYVEESIKMPVVILVIGVNGVGKTTTIGKLANNFKNEGKTVLLAAADTFRAAAIDQLEIWGNRSNIQVIKHQENSDPGAVVFDAVAAAKARKVDVLICDTAGRLHNKKNLMEELKKIYKIVTNNYTEATIEVFLVLDATTGQNALQQAKVFKETANITGIVLTKLDGTAKGGIVIAIKNELKIPVRYIGVGEGIEDLQRFDAKGFASAIFNGN
jgi:fused signal recognition particle receptor